MTITNDEPAYTDKNRMDWLEAMRGAPHRTGISATHWGIVGVGDGYPTLREAIDAAIKSVGSPVK